VHKTTTLSGLSGLLLGLLAATWNPALAAGSDPSLSLTDLPTGFKQTEAHDHVQDDSGTFTKCQGVSSGLKVYQGPEAASLQRVVDLWWIFPSVALADKFFDSSQTQLCEGMPLAPGAKALGDKDKAYGGKVDMGAIVPGDSFYSWMYIFRCGRAVGKVYGAEGPMATTHPTLQMLTPIAEAAVRHFQSYK